MPVEVFEWNVSRLTTALNLQTVFPTVNRTFRPFFEKTAVELGIKHKLIHPYTSRHNGKVERSHREDQKRFYSDHSFLPLADFGIQLAVHNRRSNNLLIHPLC